MKEQLLEKIIAAAEMFVRDLSAKDFSGHDWWHIERVRRLSLTIALEEGADPFVCELAALLHDAADDKLCDNEAEAMLELRTWLDSHRLASETTEHVMEIISTMSFKGGSRPPMRTLEGRVVQDADRLDAIGAIGISRVFAYSGAKDRPVYDPAIPYRNAMTKEEYRSGKDTAINHFHEKLLKLKDLMNTQYGRHMAEQRHTFMERFLDRFYQEWDGIK